MVIIRPATKNDIPTLVYWDTKEHVRVANGADPDDFDWKTEVPRKISWRRIFIAEHEEKPIGAIVVIDPKEEETHYWGDVDAHLLALDIWIGEEENLGKGYGTKMMQLILEECFSDPNVKAILLDPLVSNPKACAFYERCGFSRIDQRFFGKDECYVYKIDRNLWKQKYR